MSKPQRCNAMVTVRKKGVQPGSWKSYRCRRMATTVDVVHQPDDHPKLAEGWFQIAICDRCLEKGADGF